MTDSWHYTSTGKQLGPVAAAELKRLAAAGSLKRSDLVWKEGMAQWVRADAIKGLFPPQRASAPPPAAVAGPAGPMRPRRRPQPDGDEEDAGSRTDRAKNPSAGMSMALKIGLTLGALVVGLALFIVLMSVAGVGGPTDYSVNLPPKSKDVRYFDFKGGVHYRITVTSDENSDVDIYLIDPGSNARVAGDDSVGPNSLVNWRPARDGRFKVEVVNLGPGANRSHVRFEEVAAGPAPR